MHRSLRTQWIPATFALWIPVALTSIAGCTGSGESDDDSSSTPTPEDSSPTPTASTPTATPSTTPTAMPGSSSPTPDDEATPTPKPGGSDDYLLFVPDNGTNKFKVIDPTIPGVIRSVDLTTLNASSCSGQCLIYGAEHRVIDGHDYAELTYAAPVSKGLLVGQIDRVQLTDPPVLTWRLRELDFSGLPGGASSYCPASADDPCTADSSADTTSAAKCRVGNPHDFEVLYDDPEAQVVELLVADTDAYRMYRVTLNYAGGNTCGEVNAYIDSDKVADWPEKAQPNNLVHMSYEDRDLYFVTLRAVEGNSNDSPGYIQLWEIDDAGNWTHHWTFPEDDGSSGFFGLRLPHGGELVEEAGTGDHLFRFADSGSLTSSSNYNAATPSGGSIATLRISDPLDGPEYLHDLYVPASGDYWSFPRHATVLEDGLILVTDSGCQGPSNCPNPGRLVWIDDSTTVDSSRKGYWSADHSQLELVDQSAGVVDTLQCGMVSPYWTQVLPLSGIGAELTAARAAGGTTCE